MASRSEKPDVRENLSATDGATHQMFERSRPTGKACVNSQAREPHQPPSTRNSGIVDRPPQARVINALEPIVGEPAGAAASVSRRRASPARPLRRVSWTGRSPATTHQCLRAGQRGSTPAGAVTSMGERTYTTDHFALVYHGFRARRAGVARGVDVDRNGYFRIRVPRSGRIRAMCTIPAPTRTASTTASSRSPEVIWSPTKISSTPLGAGR